MFNLIVVSFVLLLCTDVRSYIAPEPTVEVLKNGSFRAYIPDSDGLKLFAFHARINEPLKVYDPGELFFETKEKTGDYWIVSFPNANVKIGDTIYYWAGYIADNFGYHNANLNRTIRELLDEYPLLPTKCIKAATVVNGQESCVGAVILEDQFQDKEINTNKWTVEHWIPTYSPPNYIFNSYLNADETRFVKDGILYLKPIPFQNDVDLRGVLNLRSGCTSKNAGECYFRSKSWMLLPPVKSAKITTKISFKYGKVDIRAKLPAGEWLLPVIRLEQKNKERGENSPVVWIAYSRGNERLTIEDQDIGSRNVYGGPVLYQAEPIRNQHLLSKTSLDSFYQEFHEYSLEWKPGKMTFSIDNIEYGTVNLSKGLGMDVDVRGIWSSPEAPYNKEYVLTLGVAVGGLVDFPDGCVSGNHAKPWSNTEPQFIKTFFEQRSVWSNTWMDDSSALQVDYVKVTAV